MSRFLRRALALADMPAPAAALDPATPGPRFGGFGEIGDRGWSESARAPVPEAAAHLSAVVREHGPDHPEALAAGEALLAACAGISANLENAWPEASR